SDPDLAMERIRQDPFLSGQVEAMSPTLEVFAMLQFHLPNGQMMMRPVRLIGVDPARHGTVGGFQEYLLNPTNRKQPSFAVPASARKRFEEVEQWRQSMALQQYQEDVKKFEEKKARGEDASPPVAPPPSEVSIPPGIIVGNGIASFRKKNVPADEPAKDV